MLKLCDELEKALQLGTGGAEYKQSKRVKKFSEKKV
jgi:hypothetical protein